MHKHEKKIVGLVLLAFFILGTFLDLNISTFVYNPNVPVVQFFDQYGQMPCFGIAAFSFAILGFTNTRVKKIVRIIGAIISIILVAFCCYLVSYITASNSMLLSTVLYSAIAILLAFLVKDKHRVQLRYFAFVSIITAFSQFFFIRTVKSFWGRQRFYSILQDDSLFRPWFAPLGKVLDDTYKSFPSGHSGDATVLICLMNLPLLAHYSGKKYTLIIKLLIYALIVSVMFSRIVFGAHYLTDVTFGASCTYVIFLIASYILKKFYRNSQSTHQQIP